MTAVESFVCDVCHNPSENVVDQFDVSLSGGRRSTTVYERTLFFHCDSDTHICFQCITNIFYKIKVMIKRDYPIVQSGTDVSIE